MENMRKKRNIRTRRSGSVCNRRRQCMANE